MVKIQLSTKNAAKDIQKIYYSLHQKPSNQCKIENAFDRVKGISGTFSQFCKLAIGKIKLQHIWQLAGIPCLAMIKEISRNS